MSPWTLLEERSSYIIPSWEIDREHLRTGWFFYLGEIALKRLQNRILVYRYGDHSTRSSETTGPKQEADLSRSIREFDLQLQQWYKRSNCFCSIKTIPDLKSRMLSLPPPLRFSPTSSEPLHDILRWVLRGHRVDIIELLRFPAIQSVLNPTAATATNGRTLPSYYSPTRLRLAREYLENAVQRIDTNVEGLLLRHQGSWLTIRSCTRSVLMLLGAKLRCQEEAVSEQLLGRTKAGRMSLADSILPQGWRNAAVQVLTMLRAWEMESRDIGKQREIVETLLAQCPSD